MLHWTKPVSLLLGLPSDEEIEFANIWRSFLCKFFDVGQILYKLVKLLSFPVNFLFCLLNQSGVMDKTLKQVFVGWLYNNILEV